VCPDPLDRNQHGMTEVKTSAINMAGKMRRTIRRGTEVENRNLKTVLDGTGALTRRFRTQLRGSNCYGTGNGRVRQQAGHNTPVERTGRLHVA